MDARVGRRRGGGSVARRGKRQSHDVPRRASNRTPPFFGEQNRGRPHTTLLTSPLPLLTLITMMVHTGGNWKAVSGRGAGRQNKKQKPTRSRRSGCPRARGNRTKRGVASRRSALSLSLYPPSLPSYRTAPSPPSKRSSPPSTPPTPLPPSKSSSPPPSSTSRPSPPPCAPTGGWRPKTRRRGVPARSRGRFLRN